MNRVKTLKVSTPDSKHDLQDSFAGSDDDSQRKPLGFENYASQQFSNFFNAYAKTINKAYNRTGNLFQHPFGRVPIVTDSQFWNVIAYIHQTHKSISSQRVFGIGNGHRMELSLPRSQQN